MKLLIFKRNDGSYHEEQKIKEIESIFSKEGWEVNILDVEGRDGAELAKIYDLLVFPSLVIATDDNSYIEGWRDSLPSVMEIKRSIRG
jgi:pyruvate dehydrogenase complex dehydrogenase (E1) component